MTVIELDSRRKRRYVSPTEAAYDLAVTSNSNALEAMSIARQAVEAADWYETQWRWTKKRARHLEQALAGERDRGFPFSDAAVHAALRRIYSGEPVTAVEVTGELYPFEPTHSAVVRVGLTLGRLARAGEVTRHRPRDSRIGRVPSKWEPARA